jgi:phosphatidylglycerophosphate synthase
LRSLASIGARTRLTPRRSAIERPVGSREFVDSALGELKAGGYQFRDWERFILRCFRRSVEQVDAHPRAALETAVLHAILAGAGAPRLRVAASALLTVTHLGLLGEGNRSLGVANCLSLVRANLPPRAWAAPVVVLSDLVDGALARGRGSTAFGSFADPLADLSFWGTVALQSGTGRLTRMAVLGLWLGPAVAIVAAYFARGRTIDYPRPLVIRRLSAVMQGLLALQLIRSQWEMRAPQGPGPPHCLWTKIDGWRPRAQVWPSVRLRNWR